VVGEVGMAAVHGCCVWDATE